LNPAWIKRAEERIHRLEKVVNAQAERITELLARLEALEAKRGPGRPPKTE
jgi:nitrogen-specific signal transduction histidine kinase